MEIIRADILGFCAGVRRAVTIAENALVENKKNGQVYTLGPLIHNPVALQDLAARNVKILSEDTISALQPEDTVIIRAHGVAPETEALIQGRGCRLINATCPLVTKSQVRAAYYAEHGYVIFFAGDKNHGEVVGIEGYARKAAVKAGTECRFILLNDMSEAEAVLQLFPSGVEKCVLLSQTTFSLTMFSSIRTVLKNSFENLEIVSSICPATHERQESLVSLCAKVDGVLVVGGRTSANTNRLFRTASKLCGAAALIEVPEEIPEQFFSLRTVGITAGASTPDSTIDDVENRLRNARAS